MIEDISGQEVGRVLTCVISEWIEFLFKYCELTAVSYGTNLGLRQRGLDFFEIHLFTEN